MEDAGPICRYDVGWTIASFGPPTCFPKIHEGVLHTTYDRVRKEPLLRGDVWIFDSTALFWPHG